MSSGIGGHTHQTVEAAVRYFGECNCRVVVRGNTQLQKCLETIKTASEETGLEPEHIITLLDAAASGHFAQSVSGKLIRCLIPSSHVPQMAVVKAISWMSTNKPPMAIQCLMLRWILVVYDYIDGYDMLHKLYGVLFLFIDSQLLLPHLCHLLFLLTRKEDVKMFRVHKVLSLVQGRVGPQLCLLGLLTIYKLYYPNLVSFTLPASNKVLFFRPFDRKWKAQVREIVEKSKSRDEGLPSVAGTRSADLAISKSQQLTTQPPARKRRRLEVPTAHSASAETHEDECTQDVPVLTSMTVVPFVRIDSFQNLVDNVERVEFPSQIAACLRDPIAQHLMAYAADRAVASRLSFWLQDTLREEFLNHSSENVEEQEKLLKMLVDFTEFLQEGIPVVDSFLCHYLHMWNGTDYRALILSLITKCQMFPFNDLNDMILEPLRKLYFSSSVYFKCQCLLTLTELLRNYTAYEWPALKEWTAAITAENQTTTILQSDPSVSSVFPERLNESVQPAVVLQKLAAYIDRLAVVGLQIEGDNSLLLHTAVSFIELLSTWNLQHDTEIIILPSEHLLRRVLFSDCSVAISRLCVSFCRYKESFMQLSSRRSRESVSTFNDMLVDVCDALWRNKAFVNPTQGTLRALSGELSPALSSLGIPYPNARFSIFQGQAFLPYAWKFLLQTQPEGKRVHPQQLKGVKDVYLQFLEQQQLTGIVRFLKTFILRKSLSGRSLPNVTDLP